MTEYTGNLKEDIKNAVIKIIGYMNMECKVEIQELKDHKGNSLSVSIFISDNARFLIGKNGQNLIALEQILKAIFLKQDNDFKNISIDVNEYKKSKTNYLIEVAKQAVTRVRSTQKSETLSPMSAYERRIVHMELASYPDITTESIGDEPQRRIIIKPYL